MMRAAGAACVAAGAAWMLLAVLAGCMSVSQPAIAPAPVTNTAPVASRADSGASDGTLAALDASAPREIVASPVEIPLRLGTRDLRLRAAVFWIEMPRPSAGRPVVVFCHGSPMTLADRQKMTPFGYRNAIAWFAERGYVVVAALRHGFGMSDGEFEEGVSRDRPDYAGAGRVAAHDVHAVLDFVKTLPGVDLDRVVVAGHSAGGFASIALLHDEGVHVRAAISFAGGKGAQHLGLGAPYTDDIVAAAAEYGHDVHVPSLWIYAENDKWFGPPIATRMFDAYRASGAPAEIARLPAVGTDGHDLFNAAAERLWSDAASRFLAQQGLPSAPIARAK